MGTTLVTGQLCAECGTALAVLEAELLEGELGEHGSVYRCVHCDKRIRLACPRHSAWWWVKEDEDDAPDAEA
jgi:DNA-directed RNA polymerase subunit RPC12/RpoP